MATNYNRNRTQEYIESEIDPLYNYSETDKSKKKEFQQKVGAYYLTNFQKLSIASLLQEDAYDYLYSAFVSFLNGIQNTCEGNFSWATVELYYTMFYLFRTKLHLEGIVIFRATQMYYLDIDRNDGFKVINSQKHLNTHEGVIKLFEQFFCKNDVIYSNLVEYEKPIEWMKEKREIVNYLSVEFKEPERFNYFEKFSSLTEIKASIKKIVNDTSLAFQEEFAIIGIPLLLFKEILTDYRIDIDNIWGEKQKKYLLSRIYLDEFDEIKTILHLQ